jgi:hypothetical protein
VNPKRAEFFLLVWSLVAAAVMTAPLLVLTLAAISRGADADPRPFLLAYVWLFSVACAAAYSSAGRPTSMAP